MSTPTKRGRPAFHTPESCREQANAARRKKYAEDEAFRAKDREYKRTWHKKRYQEDEEHREMVKLKNRNRYRAKVGLPLFLLK